MPSTAALHAASCDPHDGCGATQASAGPQAARRQRGRCGQFGGRAVGVAGQRQAIAARAVGRYITRPALANERGQCNAACRVVLKLKTLWHDGAAHLVMSAL